MKEAILIIFVLTVILFFVITIIRVITTIVLRYTINKYMKLLTLLRPKDKVSNNYIPSNRNDVLFRDKDIEKRKEQEALKISNVQKLPKLNNQNIDLEPNYNKKHIVGMVKPIGYWTSLIMGQRVVSLMQHAEQLREQNDDGYWVNMMNARDIAKGKGRGR